MESSHPPIYVTQPYLPPLEEFLPYLQQIWESRVLTNNGPFHQQLEEELCKYLGVQYISLFANGTLALVTALQALKLSGEVITTPFSFVATTHALWWNNIQPVFVDIEPDTFTLDPDKIEAAITPRTTGILPVHVYGYPCKVERIAEIARRYGLKVLYDAAHTFGAKYNEQHLCSFGDMSILSFHATKVFNTFEGGAIVCHTAEMKERIDNLKNFGFRGETTVVAPGINAKMNEFQAALGLAQLKHVDQAIARRKEIALQYRKALANVPGIQCMDEQPGLTHNYSYFPVLLEESTYGKSRDALYETLRENNIFARRYFYPLITDFPTYRGKMNEERRSDKVAVGLSNSVLCLPIFPELDTEKLDYIIELITRPI
ncbi:MAG: DegT/DnrJ/EryC1/StrS family aminotransferase [Bacteroidales bacterium]